jgi:hypothetical protein
MENLINPFSFSHVAVGVSGIPDVVIFSVSDIPADIPDVVPVPAAASVPTVAGILLFLASLLLPAPLLL